MSTPHDPHAGAATQLLPCTPSQERCWFISQLQPDTSVLNVCVRWEINGPYNSATIEEAFRTVLRRHEILRTRFVEFDGEPFQKVQANVDFKLTVIDLSMLPGAQQAAQMDALTQREAEEPFDLRTPPLIRAILVPLNEARAALFITAHQAVFDGWSIRVLGREIGAIVEALDAGRTPSLPEMPLQYGDYALWQKAFDEGGGYKEDEAYWLRTMEAAPYFELEPDLPRGAQHSTRTEVLATHLPREFGERLEATARQLGVSMFSYGAAIVTFALQRLTGKTDIVVGTQIAGRHDVDLENLIGVFINNLILRIDASGQPSFQSLLTRVNSVIAGALAHDKLPFHRLVRLIKASRDPARTPLISVNITIQRAFMEDRKYGALEIVGRPSRSPGAIYDLTFQMIGRDDGWRVSLEYNSDLYTAQTAKHVLETWLEAMRTALDQPSAPASAMAVPAHSDKDGARLAMIRRKLFEMSALADADIILNPVDNRLHIFVTPAASYADPIECLPGLVAGTLDEQGVHEDDVTTLLSIPRNSSGADDAELLRLVGRMPSRTRRSDDAPEEERRMKEIWRRVLSVDAIEPNSNFFELGGDSMLALRMIVRVEKEFGMRVEVASLFRSPTLRAFTAELPSKTRSPKGDWRVVQIQPHGAGTPIFAINNTIMYYGLAKRIGAGHPFIGLQPYDPTSARPLPERAFEDIVADYVSLIRQTRPNGPYVLIGLCVAGAIAFEAAQQLKRMGEEVPLVIIMDTWAPQHVARLPWRQRFMRAQIARVRSLNRRWVRYQRGEHSLAELLGSFAIVRKLRLLELAAALRIIPEAPPIEDWENRWFLGHLMSAAEKYQPSPYDGDIVVFTSDEVPRGKLYDPQLGWADLVRGQLQVQHTCSAHMRFCEEPSVSSIMALISSYLERSKQPVA